MTKFTKLLHWSPRIICILAILFISLFALDAFDPSLPLGKQIIAFLEHLIPSIILGIFLIIAWKWELIGGILFLLIGIILSPIVFIHNYKMNHSIALSAIIILCITIPFVLVGILFIINHYKTKKRI